MNGAHALIETLVASGVDVCFANPGTSEMHFVAAVDDEPDIRVVLGLFEGVATGAADGYARVKGTPAATLMHLGPGMANGMANLHNARRARSPIVNIVGDHATFHARYDAPLNSDIETVARTFSGWTQRPERPGEIAAAAATAVAAAMSPPSSISTLILPADVSWGEGAEPAAAIAPAARTSVGSSVVTDIEKLLRSGERCLLLLGGTAADAVCSGYAGAIAAATGADVLFETSLSNQERGGGIAPIARLNYRAGTAIKQLAGVRHLILVDAKAPVAFFAYPGRESYLVPEGCELHTLSGPTDDAAEALAALADRVGGVPPTPRPVTRPTLPTGPLDAASAGAVIGALLPDDAIIIDEGVTSGGYVAAATAAGPRHSWLNVMGGAIGIGLPLAVGAAIAAPDRKVLGLQADGSSMYTIQALWTHARENIDATTVVFNNGQYRILRDELKSVGASEGPKSLAMLDISRPDLDFVSLSQGLGVPAERVRSCEQFTEALGRAFAEDGPHLVEVMLPR